MDIGFNNSAEVMMRAFTIAMGLWMGLFCAGAMSAQTSVLSARLSVSANMDIYRAGGYNDFSSGVAPFAHVFPARANQVLVFSSVTGQWTCNDPVNPPYSADGTSDPTGACYPRANINPTGSFSGYQNTDYQGALVGMFLEDTLPTTLAPTLRFYVSDNSQGGIKTDFATLSPLIGQVFFVGDALTGTGSGNPQLFLIPPSATHLYLGYVDSCEDGGYSSPNCFPDNGGGMTATFQIHERHQN